MPEAIVSLKAAGDIMLGDHPVCLGHGVRSTIQRKGFSFLTLNLGNALNDADIVFGNLETVLSNEGHDSGKLKSAEMRGRPEEVVNLVNMGFNMLNLANNHAMQHGNAAFMETVKLLQAQSVDVIGLWEEGHSKVIRKTIRGVDLLFMGYSMRPEKYAVGPIPYARADAATILSHVCELRASTDGIIILSLHWGEEYINYPARWQVEFARNLIDAGVHLILGHHPHVLQGVEEYKHGLIVYSLGNFIFDKWQRNSRETAILSCRFDNNGISTWKLEPIYITRKFQPVVADGAIRHRIERSLDSYSEAIHKIANVEGEFAIWDDNYYAKLAEKAYFRFRIQSYLYFILHIYKYEPSIILSSFLRSILRRFGRE